VPGLGGHHEVSLSNILLWFSGIGRLAYLMSRDGGALCIGRCMPDDGSFSR